MHLIFYHTIYKIQYFSWWVILQQRTIVIGFSLCLSVDLKKKILFNDHEYMFISKYWKKNWAYKNGVLILISVCKEE